MTKCRPQGAAASLTSIAAMNKLVPIGLFLVATWILFGILSFSLLVTVHGPSSGYAVHDSEGDAVDEL
jgi:hypothetical protein